MTDLAHSLRLLRKNLGNTSAAVLSLGIGITLNATIFSVVDWLWLSPSPFSEPGQIVRLFAADRAGTLGQFAYSDFEVFRDQTSTMEALAAVEFRGVMMTGEDGTSQMMLVEVTSRNYFDVLGLHPFAGIVYHADDDPGTAAEPGVVISHSLWEREFGGDPEVVGKAIQLTGRSYTLLGVAPRGIGDPGFDACRHRLGSPVCFHRATLRSKTHQPPGHCSRATAEYPPPRTPDRDRLELEGARSRPTGRRRPLQVR
ncbi:MAG: ABC transporter permease [Gemmatimonadota bacterium]